MKVEDDRDRRRRWETTGMGNADDWGRKIWRIQLKSKTKGIRDRDVEGGRSPDGREWWSWRTMEDERWEMGDVQVGDNGELRRWWREVMWTRGDDEDGRSCGWKAVEKWVDNYWRRRRKGWMEIKDSGISSNAMPNVMQIPQKVIESSSVAKMLWRDLNCYSVASYA